MILYFDTETTGLAPGKICQLSYLMQSAEAVAGKKLLFCGAVCRSGRGRRARLYAGAPLHALGGARFDDKIDEIEADFAAADLIVAHNIAFDLSFLQAEFAAEHRAFAHGEPFCSMRAFTPLCGLKRSDGVRPKFPKLGELCEFLDLYPYDITRASAERVRRLRRRARRALRHGGALSGHERRAQAVRRNRGAVRPLHRSIGDR